MSSEISADISNELENLCEEARSVLTVTIHSVHDIWSDIYGAEESLGSDRVNDLKSVIVNFCNGLQEKAQDQKNILIKRVEGVLKEIYKLEKLLDIQEGCRVTYNINTDKPLAQLVSELQPVLSDYRTEKDKRIEKLHTLRTKQETLYKFLNMPVSPLHLSNGSVPTANELQNIEDVIYDLEVQKGAILDEFYECRKAIACLIKELGIVPVLQHEVAACQENDSLFPPNKINLEELKIFKQELMSRLISVKQEATELRDKLKAMWMRCKWNPSDLSRILNRHSGYSKVDISELKSELARCEQERRTHVKEFILDVRDKISCYWDMLYISEEDKRRFKPFYTTDYNEDVLLIHEIELENLKTRYEKYKNMWKLIEKRRELWDRLNSLEEATKNRDRLRNRGGQLLQEEKERKMIQRELPKIEDSLVKCISEYEKETGTPFRYYGQNMKGLIEAEWVNWQVNKDSEKKIKKIANSQELELKQQTPHIAGTKRKMPATPKQINVSNKIKIPKLCGPKKQTLLKTSRLQKPVGQPKSTTHERLLIPGKRNVIPTECCLSPYQANWTPKSQS